jgi:hypothetical protein
MLSGPSLLQCPVALRTDGFEGDLAFHSIQFVDKDCTIRVTFIIAFIIRADCFRARTGLLGVSRRIALRRFELSVCAYPESVPTVAMDIQKNPVAGNGLQYIICWSTPTLDDFILAVELQNFGRTDWPVCGKFRDSRQPHCKDASAGVALDSRQILAFPKILFRIEIHVIKRLGLALAADNTDKY